MAILVVTGGQERIGLAPQYRRRVAVHRVNALEDDEFGAIVASRESGVVLMAMRTAQQEAFAIQLERPVVDKLERPQSEALPRPAEDGQRTGIWLPGSKKPVRVGAHYKIVGFACTIRESDDDAVLALRERGNGRGETARDVSDPLFQGVV